jgi:hypothetical protein
MSPRRCWRPSGGHDGGGGAHIVDAFPAAMKQRADVALVERGLVESRARAQALILAGKVFTGTLRIAKAGQPVAPDNPFVAMERAWADSVERSIDAWREFFDAEVARQNRRHAARIDAERRVRSVEALNSPHDPELEYTSLVEHRPISMHCS